MLQKENFTVWYSNFHHMNLKFILLAIKYSNLKHFITRKRTHHNKIITALDYQFIMTYAITAFNFTSESLM